MRRKAKRMWAYLLVLLLLFSVAGGSGFPVLAETENVENVSVEAEGAEAAEKAEKQDRQEEAKAENTGQEEEQGETEENGKKSGKQEETKGKETGTDAENPQKDSEKPDENTGSTENGEAGAEEEPKVTDPEQPADSGREPGVDAAEAEEPVENVTETKAQTGEVLSEEDILSEEKLSLEEIIPAEPVVLNLETVEPEAPSLAHRKYAQRNPDGTYDLTLEFTGKVDTDRNARKLDVLLIVDRSGSMTYSMGGAKETNYKNSRWYNAKLAIQQLLDTLEQNDGLDVRYSIVTYSGSEDDEIWNDASTAVEWNEAKNFKISGNLTNPQDRYSAGGGKLDYKPSGGTNYQAGLRTGTEQLAKARSDAEKAILFLSDGKPTFYYNSDGYTAGAGDDDADKAPWGEKYNWGSCSGAAYTQADRMTGINYFYAIGIGKDEQAINPATLKELSVRIERKNSGCKVTADNEPYLCDSLDELKNAFSEMAGELTKLSCTDVTVIDTLSENVDLLGSDGKILTDLTKLSYTLSVTDEAGNKQDIPDGTTVRYDAESRQLILDFPTDYELKDGWTYAITVPIAPSETAYGKYYEAGRKYPDKADADTGTHAGGNGFYSNDSAELIYTWNGTEPERREVFPMPVVRLDWVDIPVPTGVDLSGQTAGGIWACLLGMTAVSVFLFVSVRRRRRDGT